MLFVIFEFVLICCFWDVVICCDCLRVLESQKIPNNLNNKNKSFSCSCSYTNQQFRTISKYLSRISDRHQKCSNKIPKQLNKSQQSQTNLNSNSSTSRKQKHKNAAAAKTKTQIYQTTPNKSPKHISKQKQNNNIEAIPKHLNKSPNSKISNATQNIIIKNLRISKLSCSCSCISESQSYRTIPKKRCCLCFEMVLSFCSRDFVDVVFFAFFTMVIFRNDFLIAAFLYCWNLESITISKNFSHIYT